MKPNASPQSLGRDANSDKLAPASISLHLNPFFVLGATTRDTGARLVELSEERSLVADPDQCQKAQADLISPRARLGAEIGWFPGVSPRKTEQAIAYAEGRQSTPPEGLPALARANLISATLEAGKGKLRGEALTDLLDDLAGAVEEIDPESEMRSINEDRSISGAAKLSDLDVVQKEIARRRRHFRDVVRDVVDCLPTGELVTLVTEMADRFTGGGRFHAPMVVEDLISAYEASAQEFMEGEARNVATLTERVREAVAGGEAKIMPLLDQIGQVAANWSYVTRPIQVVSASCGMSHDPTLAVAGQIRSLGVELCNKHDMLEAAERVTKTLAAQFDSLTGFSAQVEEDATALAGLKDAREQAKKNKAEFDRSITYGVDIGTLIKKRLDIVPAGITWCGRPYKFEDIRRIRWGATRHSINGIPTGTSYHIAFGNIHETVEVELRNGDAFSNIVDRLWRTVGVRLLIEFTANLKAGQKITFGNAIVEDNAITLPRHRFFGSTESVRLTWYQVRFWTADGSYFLGAKDDRNVYAALSYQNVDNVHVLEQMITIFCKSKHPNLGSILDD